MPRKQKKYHYIYKTTNNITGRYYYGMHSTDNLDDGYLGSGKRLRYSINKYGKDAHTKEILEYCNSRENLKKKEAEIVNLNEIAKEDCMNLQPGGGGGFINEAHRIKNLKAFAKGGRKRLKELRKDPNWVEADSNRRKELWKDLEYREKTLSGFTFKGRKHSEETKKKMSEVDRTGSKNSQFGTMWIHCKASNEIKKIKKEDWFSYQVKSDKTWEKGRKLN